MEYSLAKVKIEGRVQGVFFRQSTVEMARSLGLTGWVKNCPDGSVEALFEGERNEVKKAVDWCYQGPPAAQVNHVDVSWETSDLQYERFSIVY